MKAFHLVLAMYVWMFCTAGSKVYSFDEIEPDPAMQMLIRAALDASRDAEADGDNTVAAIAWLRLVEASKRDPATMVRQLLYFENSAREVDEAMMTGLVVHFARIPKATLVEAVIPFLDAKNEKLQQSAKDVIAHVESSATDLPDYSYYQSLIQAKKMSGEEPDARLVEHMYRRSPGQALLTLLRVHITAPNEIKPILWAEKTVSDTLWKQQFGFLKEDESEPDSQEQLEILAKNANWWARLYTAAIILQHPEFGSAELIDRLAKDNHELVRKFASEVSLRK